MIKNFTFLAVVLVGMVSDDFNIRVYHGRTICSLELTVELPPG